MNYTVIAISRAILSGERDACHITYKRQGANIELFITHAAVVEQGDLTLSPHWQDVNPFLPYQDTLEFQEGNGALTLVGTNWQ